MRVTRSANIIKIDLIALIISGEAPHYVVFSSHSPLPPYSSFLGSTAQLRPWPPPQNPAEFLGGFSTILFFTG
jgi:hypothetical protein